MTLTAAVIGGGRGGRLSLDALAASQRYALRAVAEPNPAARRALADDYPGISIHEDFTRLIEAAPAEVLCIATPAPTHEPLARAALARGPRGLLLEKPLACNAAQARTLLDDLREQALPVVVPHGMQVLSAPREVSRRVADGEIGDLLSIEIQNAVDLLNAGIHWLVYVLELLGDDPPVHVLAGFDTSGRAVNDGVRVESRGLTGFETAAGVRIFMQSGPAVTPRSERLPEKARRGALLRLTGTAGAIEMHAWADVFWLMSAGAPGGRLIECLPDTRRSPHQRFLEDLADQIEAGRPDYTVAERSVEALALIGAAYRSHRERRGVSLGGIADPTAKEAGLRVSARPMSPVSEAAARLADPTPPLAPESAPAEEWRLGVPADEAPVEPERGAGVETECLQSRPPNEETAPEPEGGAG